MDRTGIKFLAEGEFKRKKHGLECHRAWRKGYLGIDTQTLELSAIEVASGAMGDAPPLPELMVQIPAGETMVSVNADGAYDARDCLDARALRGGGAQPLIPARKNASIL